jgi:PAS domain S-box-containing protein
VPSVPDAGARDAPNRILVIGPDDMLVALGPTILARSDIARIHTANLDEGFLLARSRRPGLVIVSDVPRPVDGLIRRLREDPATRPLKIVAVLPALAEERENALRDAGANVIVAGPLEVFVWDAQIEPLLKLPRRRLLRVPVTVRSWAAASEADGRRSEAVAVNIGLQGMLLETEAPLEVGTKLDLSFALPGSAHELKVVGQVVRRAGEGHGRPVSGIEFVVMRGDARERVADFVEATTGPLPALGGSAGHPDRRHLTERTSWEAELRASEARKTAILNSVLDSIVTIDHEGRIIEFNPAAERTFGYSRAEALGRLAVELLAPAVRDPAASQRAEPFLPAGCSLGERIETTGLRKDGSEFPMELAVTRVPLPQRVLFTACLRDISIHKATQARLQQALKMDAVGRLAGGVAHDFNNLLNVIAGYAELLLRGLPEATPQRKKAQEIVKAAERAAGLTRQLLAFSRKQVLQPKIVDLNAVVRELTPKLEHAVGPSAEIVADLEPALGRVKADPAQLEQMLMSLVQNSRDAMPVGGTVTISTRNVELDEAFVREHAGAQSGSHVLVEVRDTGVGMDAETLRHVFEPFFTTKGQGGGTGLGLAMVYGIVKQSLGYITVSSRPGEGATIAVYLPRVATSAEEHAGPAPEAPAAQAAGVTILLVEDHEALRAMTRDVLEAKGYAVLEASGGEQALEISAAHVGPIHLVLTDLAMPGIGGAELARKLSRGRPGLRVLYTSGYGHDAIATDGVLDASKAFLQKPYNAEALESKVREVLDAPPRSRG